MSDSEKNAKRSIVTYSLKASETQNEDSDIYSYLQFGYANTSATDYKLSKFQVLNRQKFAPEDFEQAVESGKLAYLKKCDAMHISSCQKLLSMLDNNQNVIKLNHYGLGKGIFAFSTVIAINNNLNELQLNNNSIDVAGAKSLFIALENNHETAVSIIDLSDNHFGAISIDIECSSALCDALKTNHSLRTLHLSNCNLRDIDIEQICDGLLQNTTLSDLNISKNNFNNIAWQYIADALKENSTLRTLDLSWNAMSDAGLEQIIDGLQDNTGLKKLNLSRCNIHCFHDKTIQKLGKFLEEQEYIEVLNLSHNNITDKALESLIKGIEQSSLKELDINGNPFSGNGTIAIQNALNESNITVRKFNANNVAKRNIHFLHQMQRYDDEMQKVIESNQVIVKHLEALKQQQQQQNTST